MPNARTYFVTGTDTGVGKTRVACALARAFLELGFNTIGIKPVETGCSLRPGLDEDGVLLAQATGQPRPRCAINRYRAPLAPPAAAELEESEIDFEQLVEATKAYFRPGLIGVIEGAGGLMSPVTWQHTNLDLIKALDAEAIIVAADKLGTLNHTLLTIDALRNAGVTIRCVVMSDVKPNAVLLSDDPMWRTGPPVDQSFGTNYASMEKLPGFPTLTRLPFVQTLEEAADAIRPFAKQLLEEP